MQTRRFRTILRQAIVLTVFSSASFHLCIIGITTAQGHYENANPIVFLGLDLLYPQLAHSNVWYIGSWIFLLCCLAGFFYLLLRSRKHLAFITASPPYRKLQNRLTGDTQYKRLVAIALLQHAEDTGQFVANERYTPVTNAAIYE
jgi:Ca2+/Na+ antiporter